MADFNPIIGTKNHLRRCEFRALESSSAHTHTHSSPHLSFVSAACVCDGYHIVLSLKHIPRTPPSTSIFVFLKGSSLALTTAFAAAVAKPQSRAACMNHLSITRREVCACCQPIFPPTPKHKRPQKKTEKPENRAQTSTHINRIMRKHSHHICFPLESTSMPSGQTRQARTPSRVSSFLIN